MARGIMLASLLVAPVAIFIVVVGIVLTGGGARGSAYDYVVHVDLPPSSRTLGLPPVQGPEDASRPLVVIDPGHGGFDPGAGSGSFKEKTIALAISRALRDELLQGGGIRVAMTRDEDRFISLSERPSIARQLKADLFISIHSDSAEAPDASGASVYVLSERGSSEAAARFAARENNSDTINGIGISQAGSTVGTILLDLSQRDAQFGSVQAAQLVLREVRGKLPLHHDGVESGALAVLKAPDIPSILFETGYISNPRDVRYLKSDEGRRAIAGAAAQAIRAFFARNAQGGA